ncbi:hypothetical protein L6R52_31320 [Myxococcota bacterium]|nr:hypothetical protein [Myxococcota bacterium]
MTKVELTALFFTLALPACAGAIDELDPEVGAPINERCANQDSNPDVDVSFSAQILPVLKRQQGIPVGCTCHQPTEPNPIGFEQAGLDLSSFAALMRGGNNSKSNIVVPGQPCDSVLWQKISAGPPFGARMPFAGPPFLDDATRALFADWIAEGARDN